MLPESDLKYRLGKNLINASDFENFNSFNSPERTWLFDRSTTSINLFGANSQQSLSLKLNAQEQQWFGMQSFRRVYQASFLNTIDASLQINAPVKATFYWQGRKKRQKLFDALNNSPKHKIKTVTLTASEQWQNIKIDFNSPRVGYRSYRVLVEFENLSNELTQINIDDFSLIEWQSAFSANEQPTKLNNISQEATFIEFNKTPSQAVTIKYSH
jgi:hypothetical protein